MRYYSHHRAYNQLNIYCALSWRQKVRGQVCSQRGDRIRWTETCPVTLGNKQKLGPDTFGRTHKFFPGTLATRRNLPRHTRQQAETWPGTFGNTQKLAPTHWQQAATCPGKLATGSNLPRLTGNTQKLATSHWQHTKTCRGSRGAGRNLPRHTGNKQKLAPAHWQHAETCSDTLGNTQKLAPAHIATDRNLPRHISQHRAATCPGTLGSSKQQLALAHLATARSN